MLTNARQPVPQLQVAQQSRLAQGTGRTAPGDKMQVQAVYAVGDLCTHAGRAHRTVTGGQQQDMPAALQLNQQHSAGRTSGSNCRAASLSCSLPSASLRSSKSWPSVGNRPQKTIGRTSVYPAQSHEVRRTADVHCMTVHPVSGYETCMCLCQPWSCMCWHIKFHRTSGKNAAPRLWCILVQQSCQSQEFPPQMPAHGRASIV